MQSLDGRFHQDISRPQDVIDHKIEHGSDCRTTLMIRNLPQEFTKRDLINAAVDWEGGGSVWL